MSGKRDNDRIVVGGIPRADLLPGELKAEEAARAQRRSLVVLVILVVALVGVVYAALTAVEKTSESALQLAQDKSALLLANQAKYIEVQNLTNQINSTEQAGKLATAFDIDWLTYWRLIGDTLPDGMTVAQAAIKAGTPITPFEAPSSVLQKPRVAELTLTATSHSQSDIARWNDNLATLPGFADSAVTSVSYSDGVYTVIVVVHVSQEAYWNRSTDSGTGTDTTTDTTGTDSTGTDTTGTQPTDAATSTADPSGGTN